MWNGWFPGHYHIKRSNLWHDNMAFRRESSPSPLCVFISYSLGLNTTFFWKEKYYLNLLAIALLGWMLRKHVNKCGSEGRGGMTDDGSSNTQTVWTLAARGDKVARHNPRPLVFRPYTAQWTNMSAQWQYCSTPRATPKEPPSWRSLKIWIIRQLWSYFVEKRFFGWDCLGWFGYKYVESY
jgi:hypothetical protein